jgi:hypothetical protein
MLHQTHGTVDCNIRLIQQFHKCFGLMASRRFLMLSWDLFFSMVCWLVASPGQLAVVLSPECTLDWLEFSGSFATICEG